MKKQNIRRWWLIFKDQDALTLILNSIQWKKYTVEPIEVNTAFISFSELISAISCANCLNFQNALHERPTIAKIDKQNLEHYGPSTTLILFSALTCHACSNVVI
jgi:hypothetical protein